MTREHKTMTALVTGGSEGLGLELVRSLSNQGWDVVTDARNGDRLHANLADLPERRRVRAVPGDVADAVHRGILVDLVTQLGGLDLLVLNASTLGPLPMRPLRELKAAELGDTIRASCRSDGSLDLGAALESCADLFIRHGGHAGAAGFELPADRWDAFVSRFGALAGAVAPPDPRPVLRIDVASHDSLTPCLGPIAKRRRAGLGDEQRILLAFDRAGSYAEELVARCATGASSG